MQKQYLILLMLCGAIAPTHNTYARATKDHSSNSSSSDLHDKDKDDKKKKCNQPIQITEKDINRDGKGYKIKEPGYYVLCEDTVFKPEGSKNQVAITIDSNDVTLDLAGHTLSQETSKKKHHATGVAANNVNSIEIINGAITDFNVAGIKIDNSTNIEIEEIDILRTGKPSAFGGLQINESSDIIITDLRALNNFGCGMCLVGVIKVTVLNSHFDDNVGGNTAPQFFTSPGLVGDGALVQSSDATTTTAVRFIDCSFNRNSGASVVGGLEFGPYALLPVRDISVIRCEILDNFMMGVSNFFNEASGLVLIRVDNFLIQDCVSNGQFHPSLPGPFPPIAGATGYSINASTNGIIENCQGNDNHGAGSSSIGMRTRGCDSVIVRNCECSGNINTNTGEAFGFFTDTDGLHAGQPFIPVLSTAIVFDSCVAQNNFSASGISGGFKITTLANSTIQNCISQENSIGILVSDGLGVDPSNKTLNNIFKENIVQSNTLFGIQDTVTGSNNAYLENIARSNGTNYSGLPSGTPFVIWSISGGPLVATNPFANLDIIP